MPDVEASPVSAGAAAAEAAAATAEVTASATTEPATADPATAAHATSPPAGKDDRPTPAARAARPSLPLDVRLQERRNDDREEPCDDDEEERERHEALAAPAGGCRRWLGLVCARDGLLDGGQACPDALGDLPLAEPWRHDLAQDLARQRVRQPRLEAIAHLEPHLPVVDEDEEDDAVVEALLPDAPGLGEPDRVVLEALSFERAEDRDHDLIAALALPRTKQVFQARALRRAERVRVVVDAVVWRRGNRQRRERDPGQSDENEHGEQPSALAHATSRVRPRGLELHLRDGLTARRRLEEGLFLEAAQRRDEAGGEDPDAQVVFAHGLVEALALHRDAVLRAFELALESQEVLVALELGIALDGHEQPGEGAAQLVLGILEPLEGRRVVEELGRGLDAAGAGPRLRHLFQDRALLSGEALDRLHQVGDEVRPPLIDVLHLGPLLAHRDVGRDDPVVDADAPHERDDEDQDDHADHDQCCFHGQSIPRRRTLEVITGVGLVEGLVAEREVRNDVLQERIGQRPPVEERRVEDL